MPLFREIPLPLKGLHLFTEREKQPLGTSSEMVNCRTVDPTTEARRLSRRPGLVKHNTTQLSPTEPIMAMAGFTVTNKTLDYTPIADVNLPNSYEWQNENENGVPALDMDADLYGNLYVLDGASALSIYNPEGRLVNTVSPTLEHDRVGLGMMIADPLGGFIVGVGYVSGVNTLEAEENATVHRYRPDEDYEYDEAWVIKPGGYVADGLLFQGTMYLLVNTPTDNKAVVQLWDSIATTAPAKRREWEVPYPAASLDVRDDGNVFVASLANADRGKVPENDQFSGQSVVWQPTDIFEYKKRIWSWYEASDIGKLVGMEDGHEATFWPDRSVNGRDLYTIFGGQVSGPTWREKGFGNKPSVEFRGTGGGYALSTPALHNALVSGPNLTHLEKNKDDQRSMLPGYVEFDDEGTNVPGEFSKFAMVGILRCTDPVLPMGALKQGVVWQTGSSNSVAGYTKVAGFQLQTNTLLQGLADAGQPGFPLSEGAFSLHCQTGPSGAGTEGHGQLWGPAGGVADIRGVRDGSFDNSLGCVLFSVYGCADFEVPVSAVSISSLFRTNGIPIDRFSMARLLLDSTTPTGSVPAGAAPEQGAGVGAFAWAIIIQNALLPFVDLPFSGDWIEMLFFHWKDDADAISAPKTFLFADEDGLGWAGETHGAYVATPGNGTDLEKIEGYLAHKYGVQHLLPEGIGNFEHPYRFEPPTVVAKPTLPDLFTTKPVLTKWLPDGTFGWAAANLGGVGLGVAVDTEGNIFSSGDIDGADLTTVRRIIDQGNDFSVLAADEAWASALPRPDMTVTPMLREKLRVDEVGNLYAPRRCVTDPSTFSLVALTQDPSVPGGGTPTLLRLLDEQLTGSPVGAWCVAFYPVRPDYEDDTDPVGDVEETIFIQLHNLSNAAGTVPTPLRRLRLVTARKNNEPPREAKSLAVLGDGSIVTFDNASTVSTPAIDGDAVLGAALPYYHATVGFEKVFVSDGEKVVYYDPKDGPDGTVKLLRSNTYGTFQFRPEILEVWRNRLVGARFSDSPANWFMSAVGDPFDHDIAPPVAVVTQAVSGSSPEGAGLVPDAITGFAPVSDDWAVIGCASSINQLSGDPMQGGQHDLVSAEIGMAYGRAWTKDDKETLYFVSADGGVYSMRRGERPVSMTEERIHSLTRDIDFTVDYTVMAWDQESLGFHVFVIPFQDGTQVIESESFYYSRRDDAWMLDEYQVGLRSITAAKGDRADERAILLGGDDGYVREFDQEAKDDDGKPIFSRVLIGPLVPDATANEWLLDRVLAVMATEQGQVEYEIYRGNTADTRELVHSGTFRPGRNEPHFVRTAGASMWIRLLSANDGAPWACESLQAEMFEGGPVRIAT